MLFEQLFFGTCSFSQQTFQACTLKSFYILRPRSHQILTHICQHLSKGWNYCRSHYVTDKNNYIGHCLCQQKQSVNVWIFNAQTGRVRPTVYCCIVSCLSKNVYCLKKKLATNAFIEDFLWKKIQGNMKNFYIKLFHDETANYSTTLKTEEHLI